LTVDIVGLWRCRLWNGETQCGKHWASVLPAALGAL
jgi:hypothetical protein